MNVSKIAEGLRMIADALEDEAAEVKDKPKKAPPKKKDPKPDPEPEAEAEDEEITQGQIQELASAAIKAKKRGKVVKLLAEFNAKTVSSIDPDDYPKVKARLEALVNG